MIECPIPQDILKYKTKFIANFSIRETVCLGLGGIAGALGYILFFKNMGMYPKMYLSAILAVPFFLFGFLKPLGQPLEKILVQVIYDNFICPPIRKYEIRYPEYEKFIKSGIQLSNSIAEENSKKTSKKKKKKQENKAIKSKEYKAIL